MYSLPKPDATGKYRSEIKAGDGGTPKWDDVGKSPYRPSELQKTATDIAELDGIADRSDIALCRTYGITEKPTRFDVRIAAAIIIKNKSSEVRRRVHECVRAAILAEAEVKHPAPIASPPQHADSHAMQMAQQPAFPPNDGENSPLPPNGGNGGNSPQTMQLVTSSSEVCDIGRFITENINGKQMLRTKNMISLTDMVSISPTPGRDISKWKTLEGIPEFLEELCVKYNKPMNEIYYAKSGQPINGGGTWAHPLAAIQVAQWLSPKFMVGVSELVFRMLHGDLSLVPQIINRNDALNETKTNVVSIAPATADQVRQTTFDTASLDALDADKQAQLNDYWMRKNKSKLARAVDTSRSLTHDELYKPCDEFKVAIIDSTAVNGNYERALMTLSCGALKPSDLSDQGAVEARMWEMLVAFYNDAKRLHVQLEAARNKEREEATDQMTNAQLYNAVVILTNHIRAMPMAERLIDFVNKVTNEKVIGKLKKKIEAVSTQADDQVPEYSASIRAYLSNAERHLARMLDHVSTLADALVQTKFKRGELDETVALFNELVIAKAVQDHGPNAEIERLTSAIADINEVLRCVTIPGQMPAPSLQPTNIFARLTQAQVQQHQRLQAQALAQTRLTGVYDPSTDPYYAQMIKDAEGWDPDTCTMKEPEEEKKATKRRTTKSAADAKVAPPSKAAVRAAAAQMDARVSKGLMYYTRQVTDYVPIAPPLEPSTINMYIGHYGYAPHMIPNYTALVGRPKLYVHLTVGAIIDPWAYNMHPAGSFHLTTTTPAETIDALFSIRAQIGAATMLQTVPPNPAGFGFVANVTWGSDPFHRNVIAQINSILGQTLSHAILPVKRDMVDWAVYAPAQLPMYFPDA